MRETFRPLQSFSWQTYSSSSPRRRASRDRHDELVQRVDLEFIADIEKTFPRDRDVRVNATAFVTNLDLATLLVIAELLFSEEGREMAISDFNKGLPPKLLA